MPDAVATLRLPGSHAVADRMLAVAVWGSALAILGTFVWIVGDVVLHGIGNVSLSFLLESPANAGRAGGIASIIAATTWILVVCFAVVIPIGVGTAVLLAEFTTSDRLLGRLVRRSLDILAGVPSIVFGLFGNAFFCVTLGLGFSILSGGLTLACMVLPLVIRCTEEGLRGVSSEVRLGVAALGMSKTRALIHILLPCATPGLVVGIVLGIGRAVAETAALIFTSGSVDRMPESLLDSGRALSVHIYELSMNVSGGEPNAYASAFVLIVLLFAMNSVATWISQRALGRKVVRP